ncbi:unnamed protein product [Amoebophrya sp. A120]|nr:unnamed protein product [Amoebophrya sp. A120]|eukprot:GSA120T00016070001.1
MPRRNPDRIPDREPRNDLPNKYREYLRVWYGEIESTRGGVTKDMLIWNPKTSHPISRAKQLQGRKSAFNKARKEHGRRNGGEGGFVLVGGKTAAGKKKHKEVMDILHEHRAGGGAAPAGHEPQDQPARPDAADVRAAVGRANGDEDIHQFRSKKQQTKRTCHLFRSGSAVLMRPRADCVPTQPASPTTGPPTLKESAAVMTSPSYSKTSVRTRRRRLARRGRRPLRGHLPFMRMKPSAASQRGRTPSADLGFCPLQPP